MSDPKSEPQKPGKGAGRPRTLTTRQMPANEKGSSASETIWAPFQKEAEYKTPKKP